MPLDSAGEMQQVSLKRSLVVLPSTIHASTSWPFHGTNCTFLSMVVSQYSQELLHWPLGNMFLTSMGTSHQAGQNPTK